MGRPSKADLAAQAAQDVLKARAVAMSGLSGEQFDALSEDERNAFLAKAAVEIEAEAAAEAAAAAERAFAEKEAAATKKAADEKAAADKAAAKEERAKSDAAAAERKANELAAAEADQGLISLVLNGEEIRVHPTCVEDHRRIGWKQSQ